MTGRAELSFIWGDGEEYKFRLALRQLKELQEKTGVGPEALFRRVRSGDWFVDDLRQTIRLGLIGGGLAPDRAAKLIADYVDARPLFESKMPAMAILGAALAQDEGESPGKKPEAEGSHQATESPSQDSSEAPQPSE